MIPYESTFMVETDFWIVLSNFGLIVVTVASIREEHKTVRAVVRSNNRLVWKLLKVLIPGVKAPHEDGPRHAKGE